jgi:hypothetical protein
MPRHQRHHGIPRRPPHSGVSQHSVWHQVRGHQMAWSRARFRGCAPPTPPGPQRMACRKRGLVRRGIPPFPHPLRTGPEVACAQGKRQLGLPSDGSLISEEKRPSRGPSKANRKQGERGFALKRNRSSRQPRSSGQRCCASPLSRRQRVAFPPDRDTPGIEDLGETAPNTYARRTLAQMPSMCDGFSLPGRAVYVLTLVRSGVPDGPVNPCIASGFACCRRCGHGGGATGTVAGRRSL